MSGLTDRRIGSAQVNSPAAYALGAACAAGLVLLSPPGRAALDTAPWVFAAIALVLLDAVGRVPERVRGAATGLAAVLDPVALVFVPLLWLTGRRRPALLSGGVAVVGAALAVAVDGLPGTSWRPLLTDRHLPGEDPDASLRGMLLRVAADRTHGIVGADTPAMTAAWLMLGAAVAVVGLRRAA
ncbi:MAG: DUF2029 domain-containing protein, partial [Streptomycetaceae bacterium]|nr:DUF2029 domain-containing protein [Streptomycetaceae bacterium]